MKIRLREGIGRAFRLIDPRNTKTVMDEFVANPDRKGGAVVLFLCAFLFAGRLALYVNGAVGRTVDILFVLILFLTSGLIIGIVFFIFALIFWYALTAIHHISARYLTGSQTATFKDSQGLVGYMFAPLIVGLLLLNFLLLFLAPNSFTGVYDAVGFLGSNRSDYWMLNLLVFSVFLAWGGYIAVLGSQRLHRITQPQGIAVSAAPVAILLYLLFFS